MWVIFVMLVVAFFIYCLYDLHEKEAAQKRTAYLAMCEDFNSRIMEAMRRRLRTVPSGIDITRAEITKLGLALIGKDIHFNDSRDVEIKNILELYNEGEYLFLRIMAGDPLKSKKALKFYQHIQCFKEAWLLSECNFLLKKDRKLYDTMGKKLSVDFFGFVDLRGKKFETKYFEKFHIHYGIFFDWLHAGKKGLNIDSMPSDDYRGHETVKDIGLDLNRPLGDRASNYEMVFWAVFMELGGRRHLAEKKMLFSIESQLFYNLIRYLWIIFTESYLHLNDSKRSDYNKNVFIIPPIPPKSEATDIAEHLVNIGLAHIGRRTKTANPCITPVQTAERQRIERPFLKILSDNYEDAATRKTLSQYFMLYKEMLLFVIYAMVLRKNPVLHTEVKGKLIERLSEGLSPESVKMRNQYWRELSRQFYESDKGTQDIGHVLEEVFWGKLPKKVSPIPKCGRDPLRAIFDYTREAIVREYRSSNV